MGTKFGVGDGVGNSYPCANLHYDPIGDFRSPSRARSRVGLQSDSASFLVLATLYIQDPCTDFHDLYVK